MVVEYGTTLPFFFHRKQGPFISEFLQSDFFLSTRKSVFTIPSWSLTANATEKLPKPNRRLVFHSSFFRGELLNFGVYMQISRASIPTDKKLARDKSWSHDDDFGPFSNGELCAELMGCLFLTIQIYPKFQFSSHRIHVAYIYLHLPERSTKCRLIMVNIPYMPLMPKLLVLAPCVS